MPQYFAKPANVKFYISLILAQIAPHIPVATREKRIPQVKILETSPMVTGYEKRRQQKKYDCARHSGHVIPALVISRTGMYFFRYFWFF